MLLAPFFFFSGLVGSAFADNDWSQPCLSGVCQYDLPASNGSASGTLKIWGSNTAISDITPAAGWEIIDCSPDTLQQNIRLVCKDGSSAACAHLYSGSANDNNAVGKIVRLPENCGKSPFAVVTQAWTSQDQSIPSNVASLLTRRDGTNLTVKALHLDTNFSSVNPSAAGPVNFAIQAANVPGAKADLATSPQQQRRSNSRIFRRAVSDFVSSAINDISSLNDFNVNNSTNLSPVDVDQTFNLVDQSISCPPVDASVKVDVNAKAHAVASIGVAASGTIVPPEVTDFSIIAGLTANIDGSVDMQATASGTLDSGRITLFEVGIPGLDFPGILTIGPSFQINGQATATLDIDVGLTVGISYAIDNAQLTFPPKNASGGSFNIGDTPLKLSASPSAEATGTIEAHLIPTLNFGISALDDTVSANIFVELDASASMTLTGQAQADLSSTIDTSGSQRRDVAKQAGGGYYFWSPPSLNSRAPQFDELADGSQDDSSDDSDGADDSVDASGDDEDGSQDDSEDGFSGADDGSNTSGDDNDGSQDDSADASGDESSTVDDEVDASADDGDDDSSDVPSGDDSDDDASSDSSGNSNNDADTSVDNGNGDASDSGTDASDDGGDIASDDTSAGADDGLDTNDGADASEDGTGNGDTADDTNAPDDTSLTSNDSAASNSDNTDAAAAGTTANNTDSANTSSASDDAIPSATSTDAANSTAATATPQTGSVLTDANGTFSGCFSVDAALDVNAGANGSFFGLFDANTKVELFSQKFEIFNKCFGSNAARRSMPEITSRKSRSRGRFIIPQRRARSLLQQRGFSLTCPTTENGANESQQSIVDVTIAAADITQE